MKAHENSSSGQVTRREFIQKTGVVTGGAVLGTLAIERHAHAVGDDLLKVALIGCGGRGSGAAAQALKTKGNTKLVAMADAFEDRLQDSLRQLQREFGDRPEKLDVPQDHQFVGFDGYKKAIQLADVVILATPPGFRPMHFEEAVRQGKHVFMEKPVAVDGPGVKKVLDAADEAKRKNLKVGVGLQRRHQLSYLEWMKRIHDGAIGDIVAARCYWNDGGVWVKERKPNQTEMEYQMRNWYYFVWLCGDHIVEQHIHNLDVINWAKNAYPIRCHGMGGRQVRTGKQYGEIFDHHAVEFEYEDGSRMFSQCRHIRGCWNSVTEHLIGTKGNASAERTTFITGTNEWRFERDKARDAYQQEHDDLFDAIRNDKTFNEAHNGAMSSLTAIMGRLATYSGKIIERDEVLKSSIALVPSAYSWDATPPTVPNENGVYPVAVPGTTVVV